MTAKPDCFATRGMACSKTLTTGTPPEHGYIAIIIRRRMYRSLI